MRTSTSLLFSIVLSFSMCGQDLFTISGTVSDSASGEELIGASLYVDQMKAGTVTNVYGFFSLSLPSGTYDLRLSYIGYETKNMRLQLDRDQRVDLKLGTNARVLREVEVSAKKLDANVTEVQMSSERMTIDRIKSIPAFMGEVDVIKAIQLLPGVQTVGEGSTGMYVRGGAADHNLILLDESPVYNASHLLGIFSVFNPDAIKDVQLYKGGIPAQYGGRLASVLDIRMKDGNNKETHVSGGIGTVSSRLTVEGPLVKDKSSFIVSGRRTYADLFLKLSPNKDLRNNQLYFYDFNAKANYRLGANDRIFLSGYFGRDVFKVSDGFKISWGNATGTLRWNHIYGKKLFSNLSLIYSNFNYFLGQEGGNQAFSWKSNIQNSSGKMDFILYANSSNTVKFGYQLIHHTFKPGVIKSESEESFIQGLTLEKKRALEHGVYVSNEQKITGRLSAEYGLRFSAFQNFGKATEYVFDERYDVTDTVSRKKGVYNTFAGFEPRLGLRYSLGVSNSIKASYNRTRQYIQLASNGLSSTPFDIWFPASTRVQPQIADQVALGYFQNFKEDLLETSVEFYYKEMQNAIDFKDHATLLFNEQLEGELRSGTATAYGMEVYVKKVRGRFTGFLSYTLSRVQKTIPGVNDGKAYFAHYDKTHDVALVGSYNLGKRWQIGASWIYQTGRAVTFPTGRFEYGGAVVPVYSDRNAARLPNYHRLDMSATLRAKENTTRKWKGEWVFSVYNLYARKNPFAINFRQETDNPSVTYAEMTYLFTILPSITYNFTF